MLKLTLAISCLTTFNLPWLMELTPQVPMQYCSLQHRTLLLSLVTSTTRCCFCFGSISSFFLELFLQSSPVVYWAPTDLRSLSFSFPSFCLFILFVGFSRPENWSGLPFPSPFSLLITYLHGYLSFFKVFFFLCIDWLCLLELYPWSLVHLTLDITFG